MSATKTQQKRKPLPRGWGRYTVLQSHVRDIGGTTYMLEPLLSGEVVLPKDSVTKLTAAKGWLKEVK